MRPKGSEARLAFRRRGAAGAAWRDRVLTVKARGRRRPENKVNAESLWCGRRKSAAKIQ